MCIAPILAMYEKEVGKTDWRVENIGEIADLVFVEDNQEDSFVYTLSTDGIVTYFNTNTQAIAWKKTLPRGTTGEQYKMRHIGKNLLLHSNNRALLLNSAGHVIFEVPFVGAKSRVPVEIFQTKGGDYFIVFAIG
jgi:hypothetical protein